MSVVINTNKELFLGKRPFKAKKMSKEKYTHKVHKLYESLKEDYQYLNAEDCLESFDINLVAAMLYSIGNDIGQFWLEECDHPELEQYCKDCHDIIGSGIAMPEKKLPGHGELITLESGFTYLQAYSYIGDDDYMPIFNILYFDDNDKLRIYVPYCGNLVFVGAGELMCNCGGYYERGPAEIVKLFDEVGEDLYLESDEYYHDINYKRFYQLYGNKYGVKGLDEKMEREEIEDSFYYDHDLMLEDIKSNVILM